MSRKPSPFKRLREVLLTTIAGMFLVAATCGAIICTTNGDRSYSSTPDTHPELSAEFQRGVNHAHIHRRGHGYGSPNSAHELDSLRNIGVTWIAIMPYGYQNGVTGDRVFGFPGNEGRSEFFSRYDPTMTDDDLLAEIANAHQRGMKVMVKPHIWSSDFWHGDQWHGTIDQSTRESHQRWWKTYTQFALHYASIAREGSADMYCVGTELVRMSTGHPEEWIELIGEIRKVYDGPLTYAAHWEDEFTLITFWDRLDYIGVNAYFPLDAPSDATVEELVHAWAPHRRVLAQLSRHYDRPVLFLEAGYRPVEGTHRKPWQYRGKPYSPQAQARAFEALFRAFRDSPWWKGVYFWKTWTDPALKYERDDGSGYSFQGLPAEMVLRKWYGRSR